MDTLSEDYAKLSSHHTAPCVSLLMSEVVDEDHERGGVFAVPSGRIDLDDADDPERMPSRTGIAAFYRF